MFTWLVRMERDEVALQDGRLSVGWVHVDSVHAAQDRLNQNLGQPGIKK